MNRDRNTSHTPPDDHRRTLLAAAVGGSLTGAARALVEWLLGLIGR